MVPRLGGKSLYIIAMIENANNLVILIHILKMLKHTEFMIKRFIDFTNLNAKITVPYFASLKAILEGHRMRVYLLPRKGSITISVNVTTHVSIRLVCKWNRGACKAFNPDGPHFRIKILLGETSKFLTAG